MSGGPSGRHLKKKWSHPEVIRRIRLTAALHASVPRQNNQKIKGKKKKKPKVYKISACSRSIDDFRPESNKFLSFSPNFLLVSLAGGVEFGGLHFAHCTLKFHFLNCHIQVQFHEIASMFPENLKNSMECYN